MSEGEVEVASTTYEVLPKEVLAEVGSVKLFSTSNPRISAATMRTAMSFLPLLRPCIMSELVRRSMMGQLALRNRLAA